MTRCDTTWPLTPAAAGSSLGRPRVSPGTGVPCMPDAVQLTFDGAIYNTRQAELCFFYGSSLRPVPTRQRTLLEGWIPVVQAGWRDGRIRHDLEMFAAELNGGTAANSVQFARVRMHNTSAQRTWIGRMSPRIPLFHRDREYFPDLLAVVADGAVGRELAHARHVQDRFARPCP